MPIIATVLVLVEPGIVLLNHLKMLLYKGFEVRFTFHALTDLAFMVLIMTRHLHVDQRLEQ